MCRILPINDFDLRIIFKIDLDSLIIQNSLTHYGIYL
jgi:hypothetical protein